MKGKDLFLKYTQDLTPYAQTLLTAQLHFGLEAVYKLLEEAEEQGKQIILIEDLSVVGEPISMQLI